MESDFSLAAPSPRAQEKQDGHPQRKRGGKRKISSRAGADRASGERRDSGGRDRKGNEMWSNGPPRRQRRG
jgi:hypothetical protein